MHDQTGAVIDLRAVSGDDIDAMHDLINAAARAYHGVIPEDCWHEPYMPRAELAAEIEAGVRFLGAWRERRLAGVMGMQTVRDVDLIRHAYVAPEHQRGGIGRALLGALLASTVRPVLVGTWAAATWAVRFYERNGFRRTSRAEATDLLRRYWTVSQRQTDTSVVLRREPARPPESA